MQDEYELIELERHGKRFKFKVGSFEPEVGDYMLKDDGELDRIETASHRQDGSNALSYIETMAEPGILKKIHPKMKFAKIIDD